MNFTFINTDTLISKLHCTKSLSAYIHILYDIYLNTRPPKNITTMSKLPPKLSDIPVYNLTLRNKLS